MMKNTCFLICVTFGDSIYTHLQEVIMDDTYLLLFWYIQASHLLLLIIVVRLVFNFVEPGYYEDGKFGVRIENLVLVVKADTKVMDYIYKFYNHLL